MTAAARASKPARPRMLVFFFGGGREFEIKESAGGSALKGEDGRRHGRSATPEKEKEEEEKE